MPNTYTQLHVQLIFAVKYREALIDTEWKPSLLKYITAIIQNKGHKLISINCVEDHIHILIGWRPMDSLSDLVQVVKVQSSNFVNERKLCGKKFQWQNGFGAFSYSQSQLPRVIRYIENQEEHHRKKSFREEYIEYLKAFEIEFDERYIFYEPD